MKINPGNNKSEMILIFSLIRNDRKLLPWFQVLFFNKLKKKSIGTSFKSKSSNTLTLF